MKYGVKHYLLKPCSEVQIVDCIQEVARDCWQNLVIQYSRENQFQTADRMRHHVLFSILNDSIYQNKPYEETFRTYEPYMDFLFTAYRLLYVYFLERESLTEVRIEKAKEYLTAGEADKILNAAAAVGCGNNPQYFSQLFKRHTGITPSAYAAMVRGREER